MSHSLISEFLKNPNHCNLPGQVLGVTSDSRKVRPGMIFVAIQGGSTDGHAHIPQAFQAGALAVVGEASFIPSGEQNYIRVVDSREALALLAAEIEGRPSEKMLMVAVTGTSGKTTTTYLVESILKAAGHQVGVIGTINFRYGEKVIDSTHTTPGAVELQHLLAEMRQAGCTAVVMEVSSHALKQKRVGSIAYDAMVFTNLSPEHLDFHPDMEDYYAAKASLFKDLADYAVSKGKNPVAAINGDDPYGKRLLREVASRSGLKVCEYFTPVLEITLDGISGVISNIPIQSPLTGGFNGSNIAGAVALAVGLKLSSEAIMHGVSALKGVPGRLDRVQSKSSVHVWVDYAHKPDALEKVLKTLAAIRKGHRLICVFGCGGDRDRSKRPVMGRHAVALADYTWITSDNPRTEKPQAIIEEILAGVQGVVDSTRFCVEPDRRKAIFGAIQMAKPGDLVLIAGKGHENYQILGTQKIHFDDKEVAAEALSVAKA
ncbi:MAG: UDP-N-acetylmuramoyl-L-alanyl-D-glutamate--2,6-diaminopimelate ligase [Bdellovibrio sp.]|nr:UDP-N-acetylmuramoyl-L-alanyl-D-glutamate--2,6-diaminopimelate ligase [Bdellovibrio sp.]